MLRSEIEAKLIELAHQHYAGAKLAAELEAKLAAAQARRPAGRPRSDAPRPAALADLAAWADEALGASIDRRELRLDDVPARFAARCSTPLDAGYRPEMREMEKAVLLQILDSSWMEHLRAMDHLRSSIGLQGYAQIDPKVEYKREGMRIFGEMWNGIGDRVTDLVFRVEQFDPEFLDDLGSRWQLDRAQTIHQQAESQLSPPPSAGGVRSQQDAAIAGQRALHRKETRARPQRWKKGRSQRPVPLRIR